MPSSLRFRSPPHAGERDVIVPRTPKSPQGFYTGVPVAASKSSRSHFRYALTLVFLLGTLAIAGLLSLTLFPQYRLSPGFQIPISSSSYWRARSAAHTGAGAGPNQRFTPRAPTELVQAVFTDHRAFQMQGVNGDRAWSNMFPKGDGRVRARDPEMQIYDVAVVKQLECLAFLRHILIDYSHERHPRAQEQSHAHHCLDHVRQAVLCAADTTLEPTSLSDGVSSHYMDEASANTNVNTKVNLGAAPLHTCKNWTAVKRWIEENGAQ